ncbi:hypothetical protein VNO77_16624 [Canavalia gladiata]|uniref:Uncharacterized protein n=1 Tax=Canavalia gladiata TaxID=3824 RepID=A0AAN9QLV7_CANGL
MLPIDPAPAVSYSAPLELNELELVSHFFHSNFFIKQFLSLYPLPSHRNINHGTCCILCARFLGGQVAMRLRFGILRKT